MNPILALFVAAGFLNELCPPSSPKPSSRKGTPSVIRAFNAFQLVTLFAAAPYIIGWLASAPFAYSGAAYYTAIVGYLVLFVVMCFGTYELTEKS